MAKMQPAVQTLFFSTPELSQSGNNSFYIDIGQSVSIVNRRSYRQGCNWAVSGIRVIGVDANAVIVEKIPESWVAMNAWKKTFALWTKQNNQVLKDNPGLKSKYYDMKISMDSDQIFPNNLLPRRWNLPSGSPTALETYIAGEWSHASVQLPNDGSSGTTNERYLMMCGATAGSKVGLIDGYALSRPKQSGFEPNLQSGFDDSWMVQLFDSGENFEEIATDLGEDNDAPPYDNDIYPGSVQPQFHDYAPITGTTVGGATHIKGGMFPCGLIKISFGPGATPNTTYNIIIDLVPGKNRGYLAPPMTQM